MSEARLRVVARAIVRCRACPRLVAWREEVARTKRAAYREETYWGKPVPGFGDPDARIVFVGLAPGAHGANRTGRVFTGDRSGDFLYAAMHRAGLASQPTSTSKSDGLVLRDAFVVLAARCVPPGNKPLPREVDRCAPFLDAELAALPRARVFVALGAIAHDAIVDWAERAGVDLPNARPKFVHGAETRLGDAVLLDSYHVSQQNTQTGRLTPAMFDRVLARARVMAAAASTGASARKTGRGS